ncbi:MAG TPA: Calx-beta domain-containing protein [Thermoanaerobaculia bacterium]|nr:Calx-beta domain-containing protein [Thermoanaerobaculia bacterium]
MRYQITLPVLALGFLLAVSASGQHEAMGHHSMGAKVDYDDPGGGDPNPPAGCQGVQAKITVNNNGTTFSPATITVDAGQPVCWTWSGTSHNVSANDGSFSSGPPLEQGNFQRTFNTPGTYDYHCQVHGTATSGMRGTVIVRGSTGDGEQGPGKLELSPATYTISEGAATLTVTVARVGGSEGAATVKIGTVAGTAKKGNDFVPRNATLKWKDGEQSPKSFQVKLKNDKVKEQEESFTIRLTKATRASMGTSSATVTIQDDDATRGARALAVPSGLRASGQSENEIRLIWAADSTAASAFRIERRQEGGDFEEIASVPAAARSFTDSGLPGDTIFHYRVRAEGIEGLSAYSGIAAGATDSLPGPCNDARALCLKDGRFEATVRWRASEEDVESDAKGVLLPETRGSGLFSLSPEGDDLELLLKVRDGCAVNDHYWLDFAAATDAELLVKVRDTLTGRTWVYFNPVGSVPAPVRDVDAFATCP